MKKNELKLCKKETRQKIEETAVQSSTSPQMTNMLHVSRPICHLDKFL